MGLNNDFSLVWLKRDLRLRDHKPLCDAILRGKPLLIAYIIEPSAMQDPHMDIRHWRFIYQSLQDMNQQLSQYGGKVKILQGDLVEILKRLKNSGLTSIYSHQEIGLQHTFDTDITVKRWCVENHVKWFESNYGAVKRPLNNRISWRKHWLKRMMSQVIDPPLAQGIYKIVLPTMPTKMMSLNEKVPNAWLNTPVEFQLGGEKRAWYTLKHFFNERGKGYFGNIGNPTTARKTCSRLSPYLAWGNISTRQVIQYTQQHADKTGWQRSIQAFNARLSWHCHFIQKFESEHHMQHRPLNRAYLAYDYAQPDLTKHRLRAWEQGKTGIPIIDASMRALIATGYLNFRMRAMLVSFLCHHLDIDWRLGVVFLAKQFLDFEPGIHYPQFQMQAGVTGMNIIRIYNPIKQGKEKDPDGEFIRKWLPQLQKLPNEFIHEPHKIPPIDALVLEFDVARDYYEPIVDIIEAARKARIKLWEFRERDDVKREAKRILHTHSVLN